MTGVANNPRNVPRDCARVSRAFNGMLGYFSTHRLRGFLSVSIAMHPSLHTLALRDAVPLGFFFSRLSASISFRPTTFLVLLDRLRYVGSSLPAEIRAFLPFSFLSSFYSTAAGCSSHVVAETRRLSISIRSSRRPLCNLSADDVTTSAPKGTKPFGLLFLLLLFLSSHGS